MRDVIFTSNASLNGAAASDLMLATTGASELRVALADRQTLTEFRGESENKFSLLFSGLGIREPYLVLKQFEALVGISGGPEIDVTESGVIIATALSGLPITVAFDLRNEGEAGSLENFSKTGVISRLSNIISNGPDFYNFSCEFHVVSKFFVRTDEYTWA